MPNKMITTSNNSFSLVTMSAGFFEQAGARRRSQRTRLSDAARAKTAPG
jgi:hypothetical protein